MFKVLILQRYYNLSDEQTELQIRDRLSFLDFLGLQIGDVVPDEKSIWAFKEKLKESGLSDTLFKSFTQRLIDQGINVMGTSKNHFLDAVAHDGSHETIVLRPIGSKRLVRVFRGAMMYQGLNLRAIGKERIYSNSRITQPHI